jgi:hypothetical protein
MKTERRFSFGEVIILVTLCLIILFGFVWGCIVEDKPLIDKSMNMIYFAIGLMLRSFYVQAQ